MFWDIGAESVSPIEAARLSLTCESLRRKEPEQLAHLQENKIRFAFEILRLYRVKRLWH